MSLLTTNPQFQSKSGQQLAAISLDALNSIRAELQSHYGLDPLQSIESAAMSFGIVVRFALGLSAKDGSIACVFNDSFSGAVALGACRHLMNAGSTVKFIFLGDGEADPSEVVAQQLNILDKMGASVTLWSKSEETPAIEELLLSCHNCIAGYFNPASPTPTEFEKSCTEVLNELPTPIYAVECPPGVDPVTGNTLGTPLYASCTVSLGAPLEGLVVGHEQVGRHYICDISIPLELYRKYGFEIGAIFSDQPLQQLFLLEKETAAE